MTRIETDAIRRIGLEVAWWTSNATAIIGGIIGAGSILNNAIAKAPISFDWVAPGIVALAGVVISKRVENAQDRLAQEQPQG